MTDSRLGLTAALLLCGCMSTDAGDAPLVGPSLDRIHTDSKIVSVDFSTDSKYIAHLDASGTVHLWDVLRDKSAGQRAFTDFAVSHVEMGGNELFAVAGPRSVRVISLDNGRVAEFQLDGSVSFMMFDGSSKYLAVVETCGDVIVFDIASGKRLRRYSGAAETGEWQVVRGAGFGVMYLYASGKIRLVSCALEGRESVLTVDMLPNSPVSVAGDGGSLALVAPAGNVEIRTLPDGKLKQSLARLPCIPRALDLSHDGSVLAFAGRKTGVCLWDVAKNLVLDDFKSPILVDAGIAFSDDGNFLAWIETGRKSMRIWSPVRGVVQWTPKGPALRKDARGVCRSYAAMIRFRLASKPFTAGVQQLEQRNLEAALESFAAVAAILPGFPGLSAARAEADERHRAALLGQRLQKAELAGDYRASLQLMTEFLEKKPQFEYGFQERSEQLLKMLQAFDRAEAYRKAGRNIDAVIEFGAAVGLVPELKRHHTDYVKLRTDLLRNLARDAQAAHAALECDRVVQLYGDLARLRTLTSESLLRLGEAHEKLGQTTRAEKAYSEVQEAAAEYPGARRSMARMARAAEDFEKARACLEQARASAPDRLALETEYAEVCQLCGDLDAAVETWKGVGKLAPAEASPYERIAEIEQSRSRFAETATALRTAVTRSSGPRPRLLDRLTDVFEKAGQPEAVVRTTLELLRLVEADPGTAGFLGASPKRTVENRLRKLGYVRHNMEWMPRDQFLEGQGWERHADRWLRPAEARLREVAERYKQANQAKLRAFSDERYESYVDERRITKGMNRQEVVRAWGFFSDQNVHAGAGGKAVFEQLLFARSRKVYLKDGLVCCWSE